MSESQPTKLIQNVGDTEQIFGWPEMNVDLFGCSGVGVSKAGTYELNRNAFFIQGRAEIVPQGMRTEAGNPGVPGKLCTETI